MNATDVFLGVGIILLLLWSVLMQLSLANLSNTVASIAAFQSKQQILLSPKNICTEKQGYWLVEEQQLANEEYAITVGKNNGQAFFCFYKKNP